MRGGLRPAALFNHGPRCETVLAGRTPCMPRAPNREFPLFLSCGKTRFEGADSRFLG